MAQEVRIITDSTADLPADIVQKLGITVVPLDVRFGEEVFQDGVELAPAQFYDRLVRSPHRPSTNQPSVGRFVGAYRRLAPGPIVSIHLAATFSGTMNSALGAVRELPDLPITVIDSQTVTMGLGCLVMAAARAARQGATAAEVAEVVQASIPRTRVFAALDTLEFLRRGGRIGPTAAFLGTLLNVKPIIQVQGGQVLPVEKVRTQTRAIQRLEEIVRGMGDVQELAILHSGRPDLAERLRQALADRHPVELTPIAEIGTVVATHAGPGAVGVGALLR
ncbi:MAG: DegV family protein [Chloroflexi bacterium]|nr:DegV family protein [Chloroflexota bacterium]